MNESFYKLGNLVIEQIIQKAINTEKDKIL